MLESLIARAVRELGPEASIAEIVDAVEALLLTKRFGRTYAWWWRWVWSQQLPSTMAKFETLGVVTSSVVMRDHVYTATDMQPIEVSI